MVFLGLLIRKALGHFVQNLSNQQITVIFDRFNVMRPLIAVPATAALVYRAYSRKSLTPLGIAIATLTAVVHAIHPWSIFFALLVVFFLAGTAVTKVSPPGYSEQPEMKDC